MIETFEQALKYALDHLWIDDLNDARTKNGIQPSYRTLYDCGSLRLLALKAISELDSFDPETFMALMCRKHHDYGPENITKFGREGILIRLWDKVARLENLTKRGYESAKMEAIEDTLTDIIGYVTINIMLQYNIFDAPLAADRYVSPVTVSDMKYDMWTDLKS